MLKVESLQPPGHDIGQFLNNLSNEWPSNLPFTEKVVALQIIHEARRMLFDYLVVVHPLVVITMSTAPSFGSAVSSVTKRHARVGLIK